MRLAEDPVDHRQHVGPGAHQGAAIFRGYAAYGNQGQVEFPARGVERCQKGVGNGFQVLAAQRR